MFKRNELLSLVTVWIYLKKEDTEMSKKSLMALIAILLLVTGCSETVATGTSKDISATVDIGGKLSSNQPTPQDIDYSLERYNLIKRTYWVNGQREKASSLISKVQLPLGYIVLFNANSVVAQFTVEGKVSSLNSFLTPSNLDNYYSNGATITTELPDVDGSYGENDNGIFFFTVDGKYVEWSGEYLYSDIPVFVENPIIKVSE